MFWFPTTSIQSAAGNGKDWMEDRLVEDFKDAIKDMSSREAASASHISHAQILDIVNGSVAKPQAKTLRKMKAYLAEKARKEAAGAGRVARETWPPEGAEAALEALGDARQRIEELEEVWKARLERARAIPPPVPLTELERAALQLGLEEARRRQQEEKDESRPPRKRRA